MPKFPVKLPINEIRNKPARGTLRKFDIFRDRIPTKFDHFSPASKLIPVKVIRILYWLNYLKGISRFFAKFAKFNSRENNENLSIREIREN